MLWQSPDFNSDQFSLQSLYLHTNRSSQVASTINRRAVNAAESYFEKIGGSIYSDQRSEEFANSLIANLTKVYCKNGKGSAAVSAIYKLPLGENVFIVTFSKYIDGDLYPAIPSTFDLSNSESPFTGEALSISSSPSAFIFHVDKNQIINTSWVISDYSFKDIHDQIRAIANKISIWSVGNGSLTRANYQKIGIPLSLIATSTVDLIKESENNDQVIRFVGFSALKVLQTNNTMLKRGDCGLYPFSSKVLVTRYEENSKLSQNHIDQIEISGNLSVSFLGSTHEGERFLRMTVTDPILDKSENWRFTATHPELATILKSKYIATVLERSDDINSNQGDLSDYASQKGFIFDALLGESFNRQFR